MSSLEDIERRLEALEASQKEIEKRDQKRLTTAVMFLGAAVLTMGGFIFHEMIWPVIKLAGMNK